MMYRRVFPVIEIINKLHNVKHQRTKADASAAVADIERLVGAAGVKPMFLEPATFVDEMEPKHREGIAFAVSKFDKNFSEMVRPGYANNPAEFRYKSDEVIDALKVIITTHDMAPIIRWNRGMGVFVYNLYFR